jgi:hypothetical protein
MATFKEAAQAYQPPQTKNIADLPAFTLDMELLDGKGKDKDQKEFFYKYVLLNDEEYRVPGKVLGDIKEILKANPNAKKFKVSKKGSGLATVYTVIQITE